jgi:dolichyl-phosphate beta-glucosyltransferase
MHKRGVGPAGLERSPAESLAEDGERSAALPGPVIVRAPHRLGLAAVDLSVVVPCFNEERRLPIALEVAQRYLERSERSFELVLVDDGSTDQTAGIMRRAADRLPYVRPVRVLPNRGKGRAVTEGVLSTRGDLVLLSDVDFSAPIDELPKLEEAIIQGADVAIGSRAKRGAREVHQPLHRQLMGKTFNLIVQSLLLPGIWDTQCGFKLFKGEVARELAPSLQIEGFAYDVELLYLANLAGYRICEIPVRWINSDTTRVSALRDSTRMLRDVVKLRLRR